MKRQEERARKANWRLSVRFEVFTAMTMQETVFWDLAPCNQKYTAQDPRRWFPAWRLSVG
jgi:hypothetical protein